MTGRDTLEWWVSFGCSFPLWDFRIGDFEKGREGGALRLISKVSRRCDVKPVTSTAQPNENPDIATVFRDPPKIFRNLVLAVGSGEC